MSNHIVVWSGGADSTLVLNDYAGVSSQDYPVRAITVAAHPFLAKKALAAQSVAQRNYLALAKKRGYHIQHEKMSIRGKWTWGKTPEAFRHASSQPIMWLAMLMQSVGDGDTVHMGYIRGDCFWHIRSQFEAVFESFCKLKGVDAELNFPVEYHYKAEVLRKLREAKVPGSCWFGCEYTKNGKPCGACNKCDEIAYAKKHWLYKGANRPEEMLKDER